MCFIDQKIKEVLRLLVTEQVLDPPFRNHPLKRNFDHHRELHIESDWLLIYKKTEEAIIAVRTGTQPNLF